MTRKTVTILSLVTIWFLAWQAFWLWLVGWKVYLMLSLVGVAAGVLFGLYRTKTERDRLIEQAADMLAGITR